MPFVDSFTYYDQTDGNTFILNQDLGIIDEVISLICMFQIRSNGLIVKDFLCKFEIEGRRISQFVLCSQSGIEFTLEISGFISYLPGITIIQ